MKLPFGTFESVLAAYFNVPDARLGSFRTRIKQFQRLGVPVGMGTGRGNEITYTGVHLLQMAIALEIARNGLAAKAASDLVIGNWARFQAAFGRSYALIKFRSNPATYVCLEGGDGAIEATVHDWASLEARLAGPGGEMPGGQVTRMIIRADLVLERIMRLARDKGNVVGVKWSDEFSQWREERDKNHGPWDHADGGPEGRIGTVS